MKWHKKQKLLDDHLGTCVCRNHKWYFFGPSCFDIREFFGRMKASRLNYSHIAVFNLPNYCESFTNSKNDMERDEKKKLFVLVVDIGVNEVSYQMKTLRESDLLNIVQNPLSSSEMDNIVRNSKQRL
jgi:hypothetical protein